MKTNLNNIFITIITIKNSVHVLEKDFHLDGYSGNNKEFQWSYMDFSISIIAIILFFR